MRIYDKGKGLGGSRVCYRTARVNVTTDRPVGTHDGGRSVVGNRLAGSIEQTRWFSDEKASWSLVAFVRKIRYTLEFSKSGGKQTRIVTRVKNFVHSVDYSPAKERK